MRIQKYLSEQKILSRREAYIRKGFITLNGKVVREMGAQIDPGRDKVEVLKRASKETAKKETVAVYKPRDIVSSKVSSEGTTVFEVFPRFERLNVIMDWEIWTGKLLQLGWQKGYSAFYERTMFTQAKGNYSS